MQTSFADLVPLVKFPARHRREPQLHIVDPTSSSGKLLTVRTTVVNRPRSSSPSRNYFIESGTGGETTSLESVQRHLIEKVHDRRLTRSGHFLKEKTSVSVYEGCRTKEDHRSASRDFQLPKGWTVEKVPRRNSSHIDKYYIEHKTEKRFRSLVSVERYLNAVGNDTVASVSTLHSERLPLLAIRNDTGFETLVVNPNPLKKVKWVLNGPDENMFSAHVSKFSILANPNGFQTVVIDANPPEKVKWVLTGPGGNMFSAHVSGSDVSSTVKQTWSEAFVSLIQDRL